jgi:hypothetical protein
MVSTSPVAVPSSERPFNDWQSVRPPPSAWRALDASAARLLAPENVLRMLVESLDAVGAIERAFASKAKFVVGKIDCRHGFTIYERGDRSNLFCPQSARAVRRA